MRHSATPVPDRRSRAPKAILVMMRSPSSVGRLIDSGKLPHLMLYGPAGTGKTSTILACAHKMYGKNFLSMVLELNASDDRGIDVVRDQIKEFASTRQMFSAAPKLIILDEGDNMTSAAQVHTRCA